MSATAPTQLPALDNTFGAVFIGILLAAALWGVSAAQAWAYFNTYADDTKWLKILVVVVFITDTLHQILISHAGYIYLVTNFANPLHLGQIVWSMVVEVLMNAFTAILVQSFFAMRIWLISEKNMVLTGGVATLIAGNFVVNIIYVAKALSLDTYAELTTKLKGISITVNILTAATDIAIAAALVIMLHNRKTGFEQTNNIVNRLIIFTVNTGLLTSICAIFSLVFYQVYPDTFIYICFFFTIGRLYSNSLFANLNAREGIRNTLSNSQGQSISLPDRTGRAMPTVNMMRHTNVQQSISVQIETTRDCDASSDYDAPKVRDLEAQP